MYNDPAEAGNPQLSPQLSASLPSFAELRLPAILLHSLRSRGPALFCQRTTAAQRQPGGLFLLGGRHGSGLTTTLRAVMRAGIFSQLSIAQVIAQEQEIEVALACGQQPACPPPARRALCLLSALEILQPGQLLPASHIGFARQLPVLELPPDDIICLGDVVQPNDAAKAVRLAQAGYVVLAAVSAATLAAVLPSFSRLVLAAADRLSQQDCLDQLLFVGHQRLIQTGRDQPRIPYITALDFDGLHSDALHMFATHEATAAALRPHVVLLVNPYKEPTSDFTRDL